MTRARFGAGCLVVLLVVQRLAMAAGAAPRPSPPVPPSPVPLSVAAASDLQHVWPAIADRFTHETGQATRVTFGSSGNFFAQITNGAPFDVFLSADVEYPRRLVASGAAAADTIYEYATGRLVLWARRDRALDLTTGLRALTDPRIRRIAIAHPDHAPYGRAAVEALRSERIDTAVGPKLVFGENISQAAHFVESGNADAGILAMSLAVSPALTAVGTFTEVPAASHTPLRQAGVVISASSHPAARALLLFLQRAEIRSLLARSGFSVGPVRP